MAGPHLTRELQLPDEVAEGVDDHRALAARVGLGADAVQPLDAHDLHEAEVDRVVDVAHGVHVSPADGNPLDMSQPFFFFHDKNLKRKRHSIIA